MLVIFKNEVTDKRTKVIYKSIVAQQVLKACG